jgi:hypothetical protein
MTVPGGPSLDNDCGALNIIVRAELPALHICEARIDPGARGDYRGQTDL